MAKRPGTREARVPDLNLFVILDALLEERSVTSAARRLGVTQSAVSHALARLRDDFGDALLVRTSAGMIPTRRAEEMREPVRRALETLRRVAKEGAGFDPSTESRTFTLAMTDIVGVVVLPALHARLSELGPRVDLRVTPIVRNVERTLESGAVDIVISSASAPIETPGLVRQRLFDEPLVCVVRADHPTVLDGITLTQYCDLPHALIAPRGGRGAVDDALAARGVSRRIAVVLPHLLAAPFLIARSDLVLTVPQSAANVFLGLLPLRVVPPPIELPRTTYRQLWHERSHDDAGHRWLRKLVSEVGATVVGDEHDEKLHRPSSPR